MQSDTTEVALRSGGTGRTTGATDKGPSDTALAGLRATGASSDIRDLVELSNAMAWGMADHPPVDAQAAPDGWWFPSRVRAGRVDLTARP